MLPRLEEFFSNLSGAQRLLAFIVVVAVAAALIAFLVGGWVTGTLVGLLVLALLWSTRPLWKPPTHTSTRGRVLLTSLSVVSGVALAVLGKTPEAKPWYSTVLVKLGLQQTTAERIVASDHLTSFLVLTFVLLGIFTVNWFSRDRSAMQMHPRPLDEDFPDQSYREQLKRYAQILMTRLNTLDEETRWDDYFFAPLDAEVEVLSGRRPTKKVVDLMRALKADRNSRLVLILGDPGAGKSVALRKLAKELMKEVDRTGRLPVYINLKEWGGERQWNEAAPPTPQELKEFVFRGLRGYSVFADQFLERYFDRMLDRGRFFFLLDSFDEIPAVLDVSEGSWLIQHLSHLIGEFFVGQDGGRGVVASRFYRRPRFNRVGCSTLEIRPFSDMRIHEALLRSEKLKEETINNLFRRRSELIPVARNPFSAALIRIYAENHGGDLPSTQLDMYDSYIRNRLDASRDQISRHGLKPDQVIAGATDIALRMFQEPEIGLETSVPRLVKLLPGIPVESLVAVLRYAGLARLSSGPDARFSFVHRRLNEFFVARSFLEHPGKVRLQAIPTDSRYRDALALYCEVGQAEHVTVIADFCWREIKSVRSGTEGPGDYLRAVHCLRFLRDAFRTRSGCIQFVGKLGRHIQERIEPKGDLLAAKIALEAVGLLPGRLAEPVLVRAFETCNEWISETALHACRHFKRIGPKLDRGLFLYLRSIDFRDFLARHREIIFSLSLSDAFHRLRQYCRLRSYDNKLLVLGITTFLITSPILLLVVVALYSVTNYLEGMRGLPAQPTWPPWKRTRKILNNQFTARLFAGVFAAGPAKALLFPHWGENLRLVLLPVLPPPPSAESGALLFPVVSMAHGHASIAIGILHLATAILIAPILEIVVIFYFVFWKGAGSKTRLLMTLSVAVAISLAGGLLVVWVVSLIGPWIVRHRVAIIIVLASVALLGVLSVTARVMVETTRDRRDFRGAVRSTAVTKSTIAADFLRFRTRRYRLRYVEWLRDAQVSPLGSWTGARPNKEDEASTLLAQLDERWLGLES